MYNSITVYLSLLIMAAFLFRTKSKFLAFYMDVAILVLATHYTYCWILAVLQIYILNSSITL